MKKCKICKRQLRFRKGSAGRARVHCRACIARLRHPKKAVNRAQKQLPRPKEVVGEFVIRITIERVK